MIATYQIMNAGKDPKDTTDLSLGNLPNYWITFVENNKKTPETYDEFMTYVTAKMKEELAIQTAQEEAKKASTNN